MSFFAVLIALLIEQLKPLPRDNWVHHRLVAWVGWAGRNFDAGKARHVWVVWCVSVLTPTLLVALAYLGISHYSLLLAVAFDVAVLYFTLGFRQFSHYFTDLREALDNGDDDEVRRLLAEWLHLDASELPHTEVLRHVVEHALLAAHRHVFGVFFWFIVCSALGLGPAGAVLFRMAEFVSRYWAYRLRALDAPDNDRLLEAVAPRLRPDRRACPRGSRPSASRWSATSRRPSTAGGAMRGCGSSPTKASSWPRPRARWACSSAATPRPASRPTVRRPSAAAQAGAGGAEGSTAGVPLQSAPPAKRGRPGVALGGAVDAAAGVADAGQRPRVSASIGLRQLVVGSRRTGGSAAPRCRRAAPRPARRSPARAGACSCRSGRRRGARASPASARPVARHRCGAARTPGSRANRSARRCALHPASTTACSSSCAGPSSVPARSRRPGPAPAAPAG